MIPKYKGIWKREEIPIGDKLMSIKDDLLSEFMDGWDSLEAAAKELGGATMNRPDHQIEESHYENMVQSKVEGKNYYRPNKESWRGFSFKYTLKDRKHDINKVMSPDDPYAGKFPTAFKLMEEYGDDCPIMNYSILAPNTSIFRHTGIENRSGRFLRIHIPLIIPKGDVFLEVDGEEVTWDDLFGFNNQLQHSAHNLSNEWRMIFLIDIDRVRAGIEPGEPYNPRYVPRPFMRNLI